MVQSSYVLDLLSSHKGNVVFDWSEWVYLVWMKDSIIEAVWQELSSCMSSIALAIPTLSVTVQALTSAAAGRTVDTGIVEVNSVSYRALDHIHLVAVFIGNRLQKPDDYYFPTILLRTRWVPLVRVYD